MLKIKLCKDSIYSNTERCIFCSVNLSKKHLCSELYIYTMLLPIFRYVTRFENKSLIELRSQTFKFIERGDMFRGLDVNDIIMKYSIYFIEDF